MREPQRAELARSLPPRWWGLVGLLALVGSIPIEAAFLLAVGALVLGLWVVHFRLIAMPVRLWLPLAACAGTGLLGAGEWATRDVLRDLWYIGTPVVLMSYGWILMRTRSDLRHLFDAVILGAALWSAVHVATAAQQLGLLATSRDAFRQAAGSGSLLPVIALYLLIAGRFAGLGALTGRSWRDLPCALLCCLSLAISFSRIWWIVLVTMLGVAIWLRHGGVRVAWCAVVLALVGLVSLDLGAWRGSSSGDLQAAFTQGLEESFAARDFSEQSDLNEFWRNYEAHRALETLRGLPQQSVIFGTGLGTQLDLGLYQLLEGKYRRFVPIMHNGYLYVTLKSGLIGLGLYLLWICAWMREGLSCLARRGPHDKLVGGLIVGLALALFETSQVISGAFNVRATFALFVVLGGLARWMQLARRAPLQVQAREPRLLGEVAA